MAASYTQHYALPLWGAEDTPKRKEVNAAALAVDAALAEKNGLIFGVYSGDGKTEQTISLGFTPAVLYTCTRSGISGSIGGSEYSYGGLCATGHPVRLGSSSAVELVDGGFKVYRPHDYIRSNVSGTAYYYAAFR